jgi:hypothetical protein
MNKRVLFKLITCVGALMLSSCGDTSPGSGVALFKTVKVTATVTPNPFKSPIPSGNSCSNGVASGSVIVSDADASVAITSTAYSSSTAGQPVRLNGYTVTFIPAFSSNPPITAPISGFVGNSVPAGSSVTATIPLTDANIKNMLSSDPGLHSCTPTTYTYFATVNISGTEEGGTNSTITTTVPVVFSNLP